MDMNSYQELAEVTMSRTGSERDLLANGALGLAGEAGEAADLIKKHLFHDHPLDRDKLRDELGDVLWYVATLARTLDLDLAQVAQRNIDKLRIRYPEGFSAERSRNRSLTRKETPHAE